MKRKTIIRLAGLFALALCIWWLIGMPYWLDPWSTGFTLNPDSEFVISYGEGGMGFWSILRIHHDRTLEEIRSGWSRSSNSKELIHNWNTRRMTLSENEMIRIMNLVKSTGIMNLRDEYIDRNIHDGTQMKLVIKQGKKVKSVYFSNLFPNSVTQFANQLRELVKRTGIEEMPWTEKQVNDEQLRVLMWETYLKK